MRVSQKNKGCNSYIEISGVEISDNYERQMLEYASTDRLVKADYRFIDNEESMLFRIDGLSVLAGKYSRVSPGIDDIRAVIRDLGVCLSELEEYMLNPEDLVIGLRSVLFDNRTGSHKFIYVPGSGGGFIKQVKEMLEDVMVIFDNKDKDGTAALYEIYSRLLTDNFSPEMFKGLTEPAGAGGKSEGLNGQVADGDTQGVNSDITFYVDKTWKSENTPAENTYAENADQENPLRKILLYGAVIAVIGIAAMALLGAKGIVLSLFMMGAYSIYAVSSYAEKKRELEIEESMNTYAGSGSGWTAVNRKEEIPKEEIPKEHTTLQEVKSLIPFAGETEEPIMLTEDTEIIIGRQPGTCNYCLSDPGISRVHAVLRKEGRKVILTDKGSTNGTYVNNKRLKQDAAELKYGDVVSFAGVEYYCV